MTDCRQIESLLPPYVDGEARPDQIRQVEAHLGLCASCREQVAAERAIRTVLRARAASLVTPAPPGLRTHLASAVTWDAVPRLAWRGRLTAVAAAAAVVLLAVVLFEFTSPQSNVLFAAQLAIDHVRCFVVELGSVEAANAEDLETEYSQRYGWSVDVPGSDLESGIMLVAARRCPFWLGDHAHLLYRTRDREVSLYITPNNPRTSEEVTVLGHVHRIWTAHGNSYALVARGVPAPDLDRIANYLERETAQ